LSAGPTSPREGGFLTRYAGLPENGWSAGTVGLAILFAVIAIFTGTFVVLAFDPSADSTAAKVAGQAVVSLGLIGTAIGFALIDAGGRMAAALDRFGMRRIGLSVVGLAVGAWVVYFVAQLVLGALVSPDQDNVRDELGLGGTSAGTIVITYLLVVVGAAVGEELFFRGIVFAGLRKRYSLWPAALVSSVLWGLLHLAGGNLGVVAVLVVFGLFLAWLYERTGTIWAGIIAHGLNNAIAVTVLFLT
jgi:CAAX protease family protein